MSKLLDIHPIAMTAHKKAYREAAKSALYVQSACNTSGVIAAMQRANETIASRGLILRDNPGTEWRNKHPIIILFLVQLTHLAGMSVDLPEELSYLKCLEICERIAAGEEVEGY